MKVNKMLMDAARFERQQLAELSVSEFRVLMQECFDADRTELERRKHAKAEFEHQMMMHYTYGTPMPKQTKGD